MSRKSRKSESVFAASRVPVPFLKAEVDSLSLHFDENAVQSQMSFDNPEEHLALGYTRTMMGFLLFQQRPRRVGMIGLGGGSIPKYCYRYLPHSRIEIAEINPHVIALRDQFLIPNDDRRFRVYCEDGADFVARHENIFDVLLIDGFDFGQPKQLCTPRFYDDCSHALTSRGVMVVNLYEEEQLLLSRIRHSFRGHVMRAKSEDGENTVIFAGKGNAFLGDDSEFQRSRDYLRSHHPLNIAQTVSTLEQERSRLRLSLPL